MTSVIPEELWNNDDDSDVDDKVSAASVRKPISHRNCHCHNKFHRNSHDFARSQLCNSMYRRVYKMTYPDFKKLCNILTPCINHSICSNTTRGWTSNDPKTIEVRVACAIRYFAGGSFIDNMLVYGISELFFDESAVLLVEALMENDCPELRNNYKRLFVIAGLNPKSKVKRLPPTVTHDFSNRYCCF
jgi:hypothetical protein